MENKRITWIDAAKGIGILLVFLGHTVIPEKIFWYIFSFHMPLFFFLSGYLYRADKHDSWWDFAKDRFKKLLVPYITFFIILLIYWLLIGRAIGDVQNLSVGVSKILYEFSYASAYLKTPFAPLWFLFTLFWVEIIFFILQKNIKQKLWLFLAIFLISLGGYFYSIRIGIRPPWGIDIASVAVLFYGFGYFMKDLKTQLADISNFVLILVTPILIFIGVWVASVNIRVDMMSNIYGVFYLFVGGSLAGIGTTIALAKIWPLRIFQYLGKNSLFLFAFQFAALDIGKALMKYFWPNFDYWKLGSKNILIGLGLSVFAICLLILINELYNLLKKKLQAS